MRLFAIFLRDHFVFSRVHQKSFVDYFSQIFEIKVRKHFTRFKDETISSPPPACNIEPVTCITIQLLLSVGTLVLTQRGVRSVQCSGGVGQLWLKTLESLTDRIRGNRCGGVSAERKITFITFPGQFTGMCHRTVHRGVNKNNSTTSSQQFDQ